MSKKKSTVGLHAIPADQKEGPRNDAPGKKPSPHLLPDKASSILPREYLFVVGIGASAGGLEAFGRFLSHMPPESGMAFVLVQHLSPDYKSAMTDILKKCTDMKIFQVEDGMLIEPDCVYIKPPNKDLTISNRILHLVNPAESHEPRHPIDSFFRSLAEDQADKAIGIILSGMGTDGALGLKAIKGSGGMTMVQDGETAEFNGMPTSAIATGCVDFILPVDKMPESLLKYVGHYRNSRLQIADAFTSQDLPYLEKIFALLQSRTGHNFSHYKYGTIRRRIEKRMAVKQIEKLADYVSYLEQYPPEVEALFKELLVGVTRFFRDAEVYDALKEKVIPRLLEHRHPELPVRVWVAGCSTGEEAYSLAMLFTEYMEAINQYFRIQIFATDIDSNAIDFARAATYPESIAADVSGERLKHFFYKKGKMYAINKKIRDMVIFSIHNIIKDPPFSRLDLVSCRNLLIYLGPVLQKKIIPLFHYTLNPDGFLLLGNSETIGEFTQLFSTIDKKCKIFQRKGFASGLVIRSTANQLIGNTLEPLKTEIFLKPKEESVAEITKEMLLKSYCPSCVVINEKYDIVYFQGQTSKYLEPPVGEPSLNILKMAREELRLELRMAIHEVIERKAPVVKKNLRLKDNGNLRTINLVIKPFLETKSLQGLILVVFEEVTPPAPRVEQEKETLVDNRIRELEQELNSTRESLRNVIEELEASNEKLKTANEMIGAVNEELQSANEELETSKEELQSMNEELLTTNDELQAKIEEVSQANNDINNMIRSTEIGTLFLDRDLRIKRYTNAITRVFNIIEMDIGRSIRHISTNIVNEDLLADIERVLKTSAQLEKEVKTKDNRWYLARVLPYRTESDTIDGAVVALVDITELKHAQEDIRLLQTMTLAISEAEDLHTALVATLRKMCEATGWIYGEIWKPNSDGTCLERNTAWYSSVNGLEKFTLSSIGLTFQKGAGLPGRVWSLKQPQWVKDVTRDAGFVRASVAAEVGFKSALAVPILARKEVVAVMVFFMFEEREEDKQLIKLISSVASQLGMVIQRKQMEEMLQKSHDELEKGIEERSAELLRTNAVLRDEIAERKRIEKQLLKFFHAVEHCQITVMITDASGNIEYVNPKFTQLSGYTPEEVVGQNPRFLKSGKTPPEVYERLWNTITAGGEWRGEFCNKKKNGELYWEYASISPIKNPEGVITHFIAVKEDITERKQTEWEFQKAKEAMKRQIKELQKKLEAVQKVQK
jgi:two-component system CheB/CheR fusion protein